ncbi:MAG: anaerobic benzoate catabolism transcriptional regulator [Bacteroidetes bacterium ADurb.Bin174]|jgi:ribosome-binding protein aMBF1 (putative translation factor)|nr:MAG: anaerobic benzoate catabolism transcriptional regulator [Bacteroidetes bacterium ADurb.Bin174]
MNTNKRKLISVNKEFDKKYGVTGSDTRSEFNAKAMAWYYGEILREKRIEMKITQQELSERTGLKRTYISRIERGETDMQLSSLIRISRALNLKFGLV